MSKTSSRDDHKHNQRIYRAHEEFLAALAACDYKQLAIVDQELVSLGLKIMITGPVALSLCTPDGKSPFREN